MAGLEKQVIPEGKPISLTEMVSYQEGSIVSRMLINKPSGTVTLFSFDQGEGLSEHSAPYDALLINLEGEVEVIIGGKARTVKGGEMIIMPARIPHAVKALTRFMMVLVMIHE